MKRPWVIGITGGIASGKSAVTNILENRGGLALRADRIGHEILESPIVQTKLIRQFGQSIFSQESKSIDRKRIAALVFGDTPQAIERRKCLEAITHPPIRAKIRQELDQVLFARVHPWVALDIPLLLESGWDKSCDAIWFVDSPYEDRLKRALARGWTQEHFDAREASQWSMEKKRSKATCVLSNTGNLRDLELQIAGALDAIGPVRLQS
jgi:dephospho-CoA kinase